MPLIMNFQNLQQEDGMPLMIRIIQNIVKDMKKMEALNLR